MSATETDLSDETERLLDRFQDQYTNSKIMSDRTGVVYRRNTRQLFEDTGAQPSTVTRRDINDHLSDMGSDGYASKTISARYNAIRQFMGWYVGLRDSERTDNPALDVKDKFRGGKSAERNDHTGDGVIALAPDEVERLCENVPSPVTRNELMIRLMYRSGLRQSEVRNLKLRHFHRDKSPIEIEVINSKGGKSRKTWAALDDRLDALVKQWLDLGARATYANSASSSYLFLTERSEQLSRNRPNQVVKKAATNAGLQDTLHVDMNGGERKRVTAHVLRHSFAKSCVQGSDGRGMGLGKLQRVMGHDKIETTRNQYLQFKTDELRDAIQIHGPRSEHQ